MVSIINNSINVIDGSEKNKKRNFEILQWIQLRGNWKNESTMHRK